MSRQEEMDIRLEPLKGILGIGGSCRGVGTALGGGAQEKGGRIHAKEHSLCLSIAFF